MFLISYKNILYSRISRILGSEKKYNIHKLGVQQSKLKYLL